MTDDIEIQEKIVEMHRKGASMNSIGKEIGVQGQTVKRWLVKLGETSFRTRSTYDQNIIDEAIRLYRDEKLSCAIVAERLCLKVFTVKEWVSSSGEMRDMSEAATLSVIRSPRGSGNRGWFYSIKSHKNIHYDSGLEYSRMVQIDNDPKVVKWDRYQGSISYIHPDGTERRYNPDFLVHYEDGSSFVEEVKPSSMLDDTVVVAKALSAEREIERATYRFITEIDTGYTWISVKGAIMGKKAFREMQNAKRRDKISNETPEERRERLDKNNRRMKNWRASKK